MKFFLVLARGPIAEGIEQGDALGWGFQFPSGLCAVDWILEAFPPKDRLENPHLSQYGSLDDVEQGTGGKVQVLAIFPEGDRS